MSSETASLCDSSSNQVETWPILPGLVFPPHVMVRATNTSPPAWEEGKRRAKNIQEKPTAFREKNKKHAIHPQRLRPLRRQAQREAQRGGRPSAPAAWTPWMRWSSCAKACARRVAPKGFRFLWVLSWFSGWLEGKEKKKQTTKQALCQVSHSLSSWTLLIFVDHVSSIQKVFTFCLAHPFGRT